MSVQLHDQLLCVLQLLNWSTNFMVIAACLLFTVPLSIVLNLAKFHCFFVLFVCCCSLFKSGFAFDVYYQLTVLLLDYLLTGNNVMLRNFIYVLFFMVWYVNCAHWCCFCLSKCRFLYCACVYNNRSECLVSMSCRITFISTFAVKIKTLSLLLCVCMLRKKAVLLWM
jgi:hypothetical protein